MRVRHAQFSSCPVITQSWQTLYKVLLMRIHWKWSINPMQKCQCCQLCVITGKLDCNNILQQKISFSNEKLFRTTIKIHLNNFEINFHEPASRWYSSDRLWLLCCMDNLSQCSFFRHYTKLAMLVTLTDLTFLCSCLSLLFVPILIYQFF